MPQNLFSPSRTIESIHNLLQQTIDTIQSFAGFYEPAITKRVCNIRVRAPRNGLRPMSVLAATTIVRGSQKGQQHGAVYLLDTKTQSGAQILSWARPAINWDGHGGARGLRGIGFAEGKVFIAAANELLAFSPEFELLASHRSPYLAGAQGVAVFEHRVYVVSAEFDALLAFDLDLGRFAWGLQLSNDEAGLRASPFDPGGTVGPLSRSRLQLQSIFADTRGLFVSGPGVLGLLHFDGKRIARLVSLPEGARDARPWRDGVLFNDTSADVVRFLTPEHNRVFALLPYPAESYELGSCPDPMPDSGIARPLFAQGLCVLDEQQFAAGSSPLTVTLHNVETMKTTLRFNLDMNVRHSVHSLALWPYSV